MTIQKTALTLSRIMEYHSIAMADRERFATLVLAKLISNQSQLPTSMVQSPYAYYEKFVSEQVDELIFTVNEVRVVDIETVRQLTKKMWIIRYRLVFDPTKLDLMHFITQTPNVGRDVIPPKYMEFLDSEDNAERIEQACRTLDLAENAPTAPVDHE